jgi:hypothetical protein
MKHIQNARHGSASRWREAAQPRTSEPASCSETTASDGPSMPFRWAIDAHGIGFIVGFAKMGRRSARGLSFRCGSHCRSPMTSPGPFFVLICSICGRRVNVESRKTDKDGHAVHEECCLSRGNGKKSEGQLTRQTGYDVYES